MEKLYWVISGKLYWTLSYLAFTITECISIASLLGIPMGITSSAIGLKISAIA